jgi:hypothetical protein
MKPNFTGAPVTPKGKSELSLEEYKTPLDLEEIILNSQPSHSQIIMCANATGDTTDSSYIPVVGGVEESILNAQPQPSHLQVDAAESEESNYEHEVETQPDTVESEYFPLEQLMSNESVREFFNRELAPLMGPRVHSRPSLF